MTCQQVRKAPTEPLPTTQLGQSKPNDGYPAPLICTRALYTPDMRTQVQHMICVPTPTLLAHPTLPPLLRTMQLFYSRDYPHISRLIRSFFQRNTSAFIYHWITAVTCIISLNPPIQLALNDAMPACINWVFNH